MPNAKKNTTNDIMSRLFSKWYFGLIAIPLVINILTNTIGLPDLFKEWTVTLIATLSFLTIIFATELILCCRRIKEFEFKPKESDKRIIKKLLATLDIDMFHEYIKDQDSWYGYKKEAIKRTIDFAQDCGLVSNRTSDKKLNKLLLDLKNAIDNFNSYSSSQLYGNGDNWFSPAKDTDFKVEKAKKAQPIMNSKADFAFTKLTLLLDYLKLKNFLE
jgi:hypothetical protein